MVAPGLLILGCSATKRPAPEPISAIDRYDGPMWRTLRARLTQAAADTAWRGGDLTVLALSAEHGLITAKDKIADYDRRMDADRAAELQAHPSASLLHEEIARAQHVFVAAGSLYRATIRAMAPQLGAACFAAGAGIGYQRAELNAWLRAHFGPC